MGLLGNPEQEAKKKEAQLRVLRINNEIEKQKVINRKFKKREYDRDLQRLTA